MQTGKICVKVQLVTHVYTENEVLGLELGVAAGNETVQLQDFTSPDL